MTTLSNVRKLALFSAATTITSLIPLSAATWTNNVTGTYDWTDAANWDTDPAPGVTGSAAGEVANISPSAVAQNLDITVNLGSNLPVSTGNLRFDAGQGATASTVVNVNSGGVLNANNAGNTLLSINEGGSNNSGAVARLNVNTGGSVEAGQIRLARDDGTSTLSINGGSFNMTGGGQFEMRSDRGADAIAVFQMNAGTFTSGGNRSILMRTYDSQILLSGTADFDGQNLTALKDVGIAGSSALIELTGSNIAKADFKAIDAFGVDGVSSTFTLGFVADAAGVSAINSIGELDLVGNATQDDAVLNLDLTAYTGGAGTITLASYGTLVGTFGSINVIGGAGTIDYGSGTGDSITFTVIPEPTTYAALFGMVGLALGAIRRRKSGKQ
ncbi:PEP-CTERM sorting domain-containing protein [Rubellicoccus peritrichatus]|uniref:PEP-CTERM sorting domain-containing protein n=1 Tax=Rubellicoccus peritrichatus TaxID=3080537 RepID=A0AAQ3LBP6_9BACT|nr:PEP-CTERM sorting domain-containing protein [Puniceicoccus sp. CR14]WOO40930.1 PEP-CTERM sorting domain-containing protein [Puniceicoccus sp. CR14]